MKPTSFPNLAAALRSSYFCNRSIAWGGKLVTFAADAAIAERLLARLAVKRYAAPVVNEGGAFDVDGAGTALTTESVMLNANRNGAERGEVEDWLGDYLVSIP